MSKIYRWGILGAGRIADKFCTAINFSAASKVYAVASTNDIKGKQFAEKFQAPIVYNNYQSLVEDENVDVVYIATPHPFHYEQALLCLNTGKPVLCEKPLSMNFHQSNSMIALAQKNQLFLMEAMWTACMPFMHKIKEIIQAGLIGDVQFVQAALCFKAPLDFEDRLYNKALGGGSVLDVGVYVISFATILLGKPQSIKSFKKIAVTDVDETANIILEYANGTQAHLLCSIGMDVPMEASIIGTKGSIEIKDPWFKTESFTLKIENQLEKQFNIPHLCNGFEYEVAEVENCLNQNQIQSNLFSHQLSLTVSEIMDAVLQETN